MKTVNALQVSLQQVESQCTWIMDIGPVHLYNCANTVVNWFDGWAYWVI